MNNLQARIRRTVGIALLALTGACGGEITNPAVIDGPQFNTSPNGKVQLAKFGPAGSTATFEISATGGYLPLGSSVTLDACPEGETCLATVIWEPTGEGMEEVTITEVDFTGDLILERIVVNSDIEGQFSIFWPEEPTITVQAGAGFDVGVRFKNIGTPPQGNAGCTPGFWKQDQHFVYWTEPYTPSTMFGSVFADAFPGQSLLDVVSNGGGGLDALGRHTVAALLNAASPAVDYGMAPTDVISAFNAAYASGDYETQKDAFEVLNERGCTAKD